MDQRNSQQRISTWKVIKTFEDQGIIVSVSMDDTRGKPRYNLEIASRAKLGHSSRYFPLFTDGQGKVTVTRISGFVARLLDAAETWVQADAQQREDHFIANRMEREKKQLDRDKPAPQVGIKALGRKDAAKKKAAQPQEPSGTPDEAK